MLFSVLTHNFSVWKPVVVRLEGCGLFVLTHNFSVWKPVVVGLEGCGLSVLTHNFSVWKPAKKRLEVKKMVGCGFIEGS